MKKGTDKLIALLATLMSGNIYCPLDVNSPPERIEKILQSLEPSLVIADDAGKRVLANISLNNELSILEPQTESNFSDICMEEIWRVIDNRVSSIIDTDPCYIIFTSGSTGTPKGVTISHRSVIDYIDWANDTYSVSENDVIGSQAPFYFDNSTLDIYLCFSTGATLDFIPENIFIFPQKLIEYLNEREITTIFWVPSLLCTIANLELLETNRLPNLRNILFAGEVMPAKHIKYWLKHHPEAHYSNLYGPTEITVDCTYFDVPKDWSGESLPIGKACRNSGILILDQKNKPASSGELCVRGSSLALGYWKDQDKTMQVFSQNPLHSNYFDLIYRTGDLVRLDGDLIYFIGRKDYQIKHNGYRIELGEIESMVLGVDAIDSCVAGYIKENKLLYLVVTSKGKTSEIVFRKSLMNLLPKYMIPNKILFVEEMPLTPNGKINRKKIDEIVISEK